MDSFIETVEEEMLKQGISISQMARDLEIGRPYIYRVLSGESTPSLDWAERVAEYLGFTISVNVGKTVSKAG